MIRSRWRTALAGLWALWLSLVGLEGSLLPCPMHQLGERTQSVSQAEAGASQHAAGHRQHGDTGSHQNHRCSCPGSCSGSPVGVPTAFSISLAERFREVAPLRQSGQGYTAVRLDFLLPFSTAPPASQLT